MAGPYVGLKVKQGLNFSLSEQPSTDYKAMHKTQHLEREGSVLQPEEAMKQASWPSSVGSYKQI